MNFPATPIYEGVKVCRMAKGEWTQEWEEHPHPRGGNYFWLVGSFCLRDDHPHDADRPNLTEGYVAVTPIQIDMTDYRMMEEMINDWDFNL